ncbi:MAG: hypothetical protein ACTHJR_03210 [Sphingomonas sp.]|uniref:hypothetical protein n=1 Tax=Sphingomonas sp. TaxID=28214 RepID=UPI003F7FFCA7
MSRNLRRLAAVSAVAVAIAWSGVAAAQTEGGSDTDTKNFAVTGNVPAMCVGGTLAGTGATFDMGVLIDLNTGLLRTDLAAPSKVLSGSFCSTRSTITVAATPMTAQTFTATPPSGFSRTVNYTATAAGWTDTPASFATGAASNPAAVQTRATAFSGDITVSVGSFSTGGGATQRLVADTNYQGNVTVTLAVAS